MIAGDVEAVRGAWVMRGEAAVFVDRTFQSPDLQLDGPSAVVYEGHAIEAGGSSSARRATIASTWPC